MPEQTSITDKEILDLAWKYFQQHASQRISFFNFFVVFSSIMTTGLITTFSPQFKIHMVGIAIGIMLSLISFVFWKVDDRNKHLTKCGENALKKLEERFYCVTDGDASLNPAQIFTCEEAVTDRLREEQRRLPFWKKQVSHSLCFNAIFVIYGVVGLLGAAYSGYMLYTTPSMQTRAVALPVTPPIVSRKVLGTAEIIQTITIEPHITGNQDELPLELKRWNAQPTSIGITQPDQMVPVTQEASTPVKSKK